MSIWDEYSLVTSVHLALLYFLLQRPYVFTSPAALGAKYVEHIDTHLLSNHFVPAIPPFKSVRQPGALLKKRLWDRCFPVNFAKFLRVLF